jgi:hypothetical protein
MFIQFLARFAIAGVVVPLLMSSVWWLTNSLSKHSLSFEIVLERITLMVWPSSFALLAGAGFGDASLGWRLITVSMAINAIVYTVIGALLWYGLKRNYLVLTIPVMAIGALWIWALFFR